MLVLAAIPDAQLQRLRRATATRFTFVHAGNWGETLAVIRSRPVEIAVVDPLLSGAARALEIERLRLLFPSPPSCAGCWRRHCARPGRCRRCSTWRPARGWTGGPASAGSAAWACRARG